MIDPGKLDALRRAHLEETAREFYGKAKAAFTFRQSLVKESDQDDQRLRELLPVLCQMTNFAPAVEAYDIIARQRVRLLDALDAMEVESQCMGTALAADALLGAMPAPAPAPPPDGA